MYRSSRRQAHHSHQNPPEPLGWSATHRDSGIYRLRGAFEHAHQAFVEHLATSTPLSTPSSATLPVPPAGAAAAVSQPQESTLRCMASIHESSRPLDNQQPGSSCSAADQGAPLRGAFEMHRHQQDDERHLSGIRRDGDGGPSPAAAPSVGVEERTSALWRQATQEEHSKAGEQATQNGHVASQLDGLRRRSALRRSR